MRSRWIEMVIACSVVALTAVGVWSIFGERIEDALDGHARPSAASDPKPDSPRPNSRMPTRGQDLW